MTTRTQPQAQQPDPQLVLDNVRAALREDVGDGDRSAPAVCADQQCNARLVTREPAVLCGAAWFEATFRELDPAVTVVWSAHEGDTVRCGQILCGLQGNARALLAAERTALNFLQLLSGVATVTRRYAELLQDGECNVLDTRKTIPGLRLAQKYAVRVGGGHNHRNGLYDGIMLKENHLRAGGGIGAAFATVRSQQQAGLMVEVEVENLDELEQALSAGAVRILLDNFSLSQLREAVRRTAGRATLEASGNVTLENLREIAATGVALVSVGDLTKNLRAVDYSLLFDFGAP